MGDLRLITVELKHGVAELTPEKVLSCAFGISEEAARAYILMLKREDEAPFTVEEVGELMNRSRSVAQRALQALMKVGLVKREPRILPRGGRRYLYTPVSWEVARKLGKDNVRRICETIERWFDEFEVEEAEGGEKDVGKASVQG